MAQGFSFALNDFKSAGTRITDKLFTNSEAGVAGEAVKLVNGRWTKASGTDAPGGILNNNVKAGTDQEADVTLITPGDWFSVPYTGTPDAAFKEGVVGVTISADGLSLNAATITGGAIAVLNINTNTATAFVKFKSRQFS
ncbi:hypothetical protein [Paenibacillus peoriae]|uniref:hypothetical protein n=1 Tax=Paenibacillus peoriae TaxID=59893 RepID=UPI00096D8465|nr:hypothetical protein [Paenibacillus peoriae]OMF48595.1 hypothetical protein BK135_09875 [Paenibacillus peoriae]